MGKKHQVPLTVEEQIVNLHNLGLIIEDEEAAKSLLNDIEINIAKKLMIWYPCFRQNKGTIFVKRRIWYPFYL